MCMGVITSGECVRSHLCFTVQAIIYSYAPTVHLPYTYRVTYSTASPPHRLTASPPHRLTAQVIICDESQCLKSRTALRTKAMLPLLKVRGAHTHTHTHARTHAHTHARTHAHAPRHLTVSSFFLSHHLTTLPSYHLTILPPYHLTALSPYHLTGGATCAAPLRHPRPLASRRALHTTQRARRRRLPRLQGYTRDTHSGDMYQYSSRAPRAAPQKPTTGPDLPVGPPARFLSLSLSVFHVSVCPSLHSTPPGVRVPRPLPSATATRSRAVTASTPPAARTSPSCTRCSSPPWGYGASRKTCSHSCLRSDGPVCCCPPPPVPMAEASHGCAK